MRKHFMVMEESGLVTNHAAQEARADADFVLEALRQSLVMLEAEKRNRVERDKSVATRLEQFASALKDDSEEYHRTIDTVLSGLVGAIRRIEGSAEVENG